MTTLASATLELARILTDVVESTATADGTSGGYTIVDTAIPRIDLNENHFKGGVSWIQSGTCTGMSRKTLSFSGGTGRYSVQTYGLRISSGVSYAASLPYYPQDVLKRAINTALVNISPILAMLDTDTTVADQESYSLGTGVRNVKLIEIATSFFSTHILSLASSAMIALRKMPAPQAPNVIVLEKRTGRLVATDDTPVASRMLHGQWSSLSLGTVAGRKLVFFGAGDGFCYALEPLSAVPDKPVKLKTVWSYDCNPPEYKMCEGLDWVTHYCMGDRRWGTNNNDGSYVGTSEIIGTPILVSNRVYVALGRDPEHGRGRGAMHCIDATKTGDITQTGRVWTYQGLDRMLCTASVADGLVYIGDVAGRLHCLDAARLVGLAVKLPYAFALYGWFPISLREHLRASVTLWEATAPVKLPTTQCPRPG